jgi:hypothetical protein
VAVTANNPNEEIGIREITSKYNKAIGVSSCPFVDQIFVNETTRTLKTKLPANRSGQSGSSLYADENVARFLKTARTLVYCALGHKLRRPTLIAGTVRNQLSEFSNQRRHFLERSQDSQ